MSRRSLLFGVLLASLWSFSSTSTSAASEPLVQVGPASSPWLSHSDRLAGLDPSEKVGVQLALNLRDQAGLKDLIARLSTPGSPDYGHYLTAKQVEDRFGPTEEQVQRVADHLRSQGLTVTNASAGNFLVEAIGSAAQVAQATHTSLSRYRDRKTSREFFANDSPPTLPADVAAAVQGVIGLDNHALRRPSAPPCQGCANAPYTPTQVRAGYNFNASPISALTGTGQSLGLLELNTFNQANVTQFDGTYGIATGTPTVYTVPDGFGNSISSTFGGEVEVELDIDVMQGIAPGASILVFEAPNTNAGVNRAYDCMWRTSPSYCPNLTTAASNSTSWGLCENDQGPTETNVLDSIFSQAAATGHSFYAASGDLGTKDGCSVTPAVDSPASDPFVTGAGGTKLFLNGNDNSWNSETAWPAEPGPALGGGGGLSTSFSRPSWQTGPGVANAFSNNQRQVPDIAADADPVTGFSVYTCSSSQNQQTCSPGFFSIGGTSAAAPAWAAFTAIYNQYAISLGRPNLGPANPILYGVGSCPGATAAYHDVTTGSNPNNSPFSPTAGWDYLTGWGSFDASALADQLVTYTAPSGPVDRCQSTLSASPSSVLADGSTTSTITVTLKNSSGSAVAGKAVALAKAFGPGTPVVSGPTPSITGLNGQTTFTVKSTTSGLDSFRATDTSDSTPIAQIARVSFTQGAINAGLSTVGASPTSVPADGSTVSTVTVTLKDGNGNGIPGKTVSLTKSSGPGSPTIAGPSPASTDASGQTTFAVKSTTIGTDTFQATDTTDANVVVTQTASVNFTTLPGNAANSSVSASPLTVPADDATTSTITVTIRDINNTPVAGKTVSLAKISGPGSPTIANPVPATTTASGQTTFAVKSTTNGTDTFRATDTTDGVIVTMTASVTFGVSDTISTVGASPTVVPADGGTVSTITVTLRDGSGNAVAGRTVSLAKSAGPGTPNISPASATTDGAGVSTFTVKSKNIGADTFQAIDQTDGNLVLRQTASVSFAAGGYTLDGYGGLHNYGAATAVPDGSHAYWPGWRIVRGVALCPGNSNGGVTVDGYGGVHGFGPSINQNPSLSAYWSGWDIARGVVLTSCSSGPQGYVLDGYGGMHAFGGVGPDPAISGYWPGWDIAVAAATCPDLPGSGYVMDGYGGVHAYGSAPANPNMSAYWGGWRIARGLTVAKCSGGVSGYTLDGYGGVHNFGSGTLVDPGTGAYWPGWDIARGIDILSDGSGGFVLDGYGGIHPFSITTMPATPPISAYWPGWDIARAIGGST